MSLLSVIAQRFLSGCVLTTSSGGTGQQDMLSGQGWEDLEFGLLPGFHLRSRDMAQRWKTLAALLKALAPTCHVPCSSTHMPPNSRASASLFWPGHTHGATSTYKPSMHAHKFFS